MQVYHKSIQELFMPKQSEKMKLERERVQATLMTKVREKRPHENYLNYVKQVNQRKQSNNLPHSSRDDGSEVQKNSLRAVASLPNLPKRIPQSEQKHGSQTPGDDVIYSTRNLRAGTRPTVNSKKSVTSQRPRTLHTQQSDEDEDMINLQKSKLLSKIGNENMQYAKR